MRVRLFLTLLLVFSLVPVVGASAHKAGNSCGHQNADGAGWYEAYGHNVGCKKTREVARRWSDKCSRKGCREGETVRIYVAPGFTCRHRQHGYESVRVKCTAEGDRIVHFLWGS
jgi:hypothetical protein